VPISGKKKKRSANPEKREPNSRKERKISRSYQEEYRRGDRQIIRKSRAEEAPK